MVHKISCLDIKFFLKLVFKKCKKNLIVSDWLVYIFVLNISFKKFIILGYAFNSSCICIFRKKFV